MKNLEKLAKKVVMSDQFLELKELMPQLYRLTQNLYKDVEYGTVPPDLEERVERHFKYLWRYLNLGDNISLTEPEAAFVGDMHRNAQMIRSLQSDKMRAKAFGEGKAMKITKKQLTKLIESLVREQTELSPRDQKIQMLWKVLFETIDPRAFKNTWQRKGEWFHESRFLKRYVFETDDSDYDHKKITIDYRGNGKFTIAVFDVEGWTGNKTLLFGKDDLPPKAAGQIIKKVLEKEGWYHS